MLKRHYSPGIPMKLNQKKAKIMKPLLFLEKNIKKEKIFLI